jgi:hypothetical protein
LFGCSTWNISDYGGIDGAGVPGGGFGDETIEEGFGGWADVVASLGVPLDAQDEVVSGGIRGLAAFYCFDDAVLGATGRYAKVVAGDADGLVVAGVDGETEETILFGGLFGGNDGSEEGIWGYGGGVGDGHGASGGVVDRHRDEVLDEGSAAPDVEGLGAETDGEDGFVQVMGVLDEEFVDVFAGWVGGTALRDGILTVFLGVYVGGTAGKEDSMAGVDEVGGFAGGDVEGDFNGFATGAGDGFGILRPGFVVVFEISASGDGDGYAGFHAG